jgi:hypothetical protein
MIERLFRRFVSEQDGIALVIALATMTILAITTTGVIVAGSSNEDTAWVSTKGRAAFAVAQQSLAYGEGMVYGDLNQAPSVTPPTTVQNLPTQANGATGTYVSSTADNIVWHVVGTGTYLGTTRTVSADITPSRTVITQQGVPLWSYLYENSLTPPCVQGGAIINEPILARGDFCVKGGSKILNILELGGTLTTTGNNTSIGSASSPVPKLKIANTTNPTTACSILGSATAIGVGTCDGSHTGAYASVTGTTLDAAALMPAVNFQAAYNTQAALTKTGCPAGLFDNDSTWNNSLTDAGTIMFGAAYDCKVGTTYELKWTPSTHNLYMNGTFYFDGGLGTMPATATTYTGQASLYFTGGVRVNNSSFCGIANCTAQWNPNLNEAIFVMGCQGVQPNGGCFYIGGNSMMQVGVYSTGDYQVTGGSGNWGPVLCDTFQIAGGTNLLIPFNTFPPGTPGQTSYTTVAGSPPTGWNG